MAWTEKLASGRHRGMYRDADGKKKSAGVYDLKRTAKAKADEAEVNARGEQTAPASSMPWGEWEQTWQTHRRVTEGTRYRDESRLEHHIRPRWEKTPLSDITRAKVQAWTTELSQNLAPSSVQKTVRLLSASLSDAVRNDLIPANPCSRIELPKIPPAPEKWWSEDEVDALRGALPESHHFTFGLLLGTGMRWGEMAGLHWDHVDTRRNTIEVVWAWDRYSKTMTPPKSHQTRVVPIGKSLSAELAERRKQGFGERPPVEYKGSVKPRHGLVVANNANMPVNPVSFAHALTAAGLAAHVGEGRERRQVGDATPHMCRHTYATRLVQAGVPLAQVQAILGHSSVLVTQRYARVGESGWDAVRSVIG